MIIVDQLSASIPLLRWLGQNRIVFYCHFPDLLLSPSRPASHALNDPRAARPWSIAGQVRSFYRRPIDALEEATTGEADKILVNSDFTAQVFERTFPGLYRLPRVVYPSVDVHSYGKEVKPARGDEWLVAYAYLSHLSFARMMTLDASLAATKRPRFFPSTASKPRRTWLSLSGLSVKHRHSTRI